MKRKSVLKRGMRVSVVHQRAGILPMRITGIHGGTFEAGSEPYKVVRHIANEGISWCRGWEGEAVDALKAALALH